MKNIKERVLKDEVLRNKIQKYVNFPDKESRDELDKMLAELFHQGKIQNLAEIGKVIDEEIKTEQECMKRDKYEEQEIEHINQIEMANKIKQKLGIK